MKKLAFLFMAFQVFYSLAQPAIKFDTQTYDFGEIKEGEMAIFDFTFTNTGNAPLILGNVQPSCGCTTPEWSRDPVAPGEKGKIKAMYNTIGRPGFFNKSINVTSNGEPASAILYIKGSVNKREEAEKKYTEAEIKLSPKLVIDKTQHAFGKVEKNTQLIVKLQVKNLGRSDLRISEVTSACQCVRPIFKEDFIKSGSEGTVELVYTPPAMGENRDVVYLKSNDVTNSSQKFVLTATIVDRLAAKNLMKENETNVPFK
ncbi:MAG: DUF1573 domain-containing protein [Bacteroidota bacterium]|nr:DUF1573 domain-containing protein [Bacteroidota bacterium]